MKGRILVLAGALSLLAGAALADDPMANTYDNTVMTKNQATGASSTLLFNKDMTYIAKAIGADGKPVQYTGSWSLEDAARASAWRRIFRQERPTRPSHRARPLQLIMSATAGQ